MRELEDIFQRLRGQKSINQNHVIGNVLNFFTLEIGNDTKMLVARSPLFFSIFSKSSFHLGTSATIRLGSRGSLLVSLA